MLMQVQWKSDDFPCSLFIDYINPNVLAILSSTTIKASFSIFCLQQNYSSMTYSLLSSPLFQK
uniref:Putative ovule protein n=1 Tax=Solanum chacoense TaxID=4108 RepID=A0A0V0GPA5_SOLCH